MAAIDRALREAGLPIHDEWIVPSPLSIEAGKQAMEHLLTLSERPRAVFVSNNLITLGALIAIRSLGLACPQEVAVVGFDDHPWAVVASPPLTVVRQPAREVGRVAAEILCALIDDDGPVAPTTILKCDLVLRESS